MAKLRSILRRARVHALGLACLVLAAVAGPAIAADYTSGFGIAISVPDTYLVLTRDEVRKNADLFVGEEGLGQLGAIPEAMRREVFDRVRSGQLEIFYRTTDVDERFVDNVNIMRQDVALPESGEQLREICALLPSEFSRMFGRPIAMDGCEMRSVARRRALYLAFDGALPGTKTIQYQVQTQPGTTLILTATATEGTISRMLGEFEGMVRSIRMR